MQLRSFVLSMYMTMASLFGSAFSDDGARMLFDFKSPTSVDNWQIVNDGVMGGRSSSRVRLSDENYLRFVGNISLANNGGFASVRSRPQRLGMQSLALRSDDVIKLRVKGDGRVYTFNLYTPDRRTAFSFQRNFRTLDGEWAEVRLPIKDFVAHSFGRPLPGEKLDPSRVQSIGILLGDKRSGPFEILVASIEVQRN